MKHTRKFSATDLDRFLKANKSLREANPGLDPLSQIPRLAPQLTAKALLSGPMTILPKPASKGKKRGVMNATEREFSKYLEHKRLENEILSWQYEGITLRYGDIRYTPDFFVVTGIMPCEDLDGNVTGPPLTACILYEVKGAHKWTKDVLRFKAIRTHFTCFEFQLWEKKDGGWHQSI